MEGDGSLLLLYCVYSQRVIATTCSLRQAVTHATVHAESVSRLEVEMVPSEWAARLSRLFALLGGGYGWGVGRVGGAVRRTRLDDGVA